MTMTFAYVEDDLWTMSNLFPEDTGLPMTVWIRPRSNERHGPRIKVCTMYGPRMYPDQTVTVTLGSPPEDLQGELSADDLRSVRRWIELNREAIKEHWEGRTSSMQFARDLKKISWPRATID